MSVHQDLIVERHGPTDGFAGLRLSWGGIFGGVLVGVGLLLLLTTLGLAIGISAVDPVDPDAQTIGMGAGIWASLSLLVSLFVAGWAATRLGMLWDRTTAVFEGGLVWVVSMILIFYLAANGVGLIAGGALNLTSGATRAVSSVATDGGLADLSSGDVDQILQRLSDPSTAAQLATALGMPQQEVAQTLAVIRTRVEAARNNPGEAVAAVREGARPLIDRARERAASLAQEAQPAATTTAWITFGALLLSLLACVGGATVGRRNAASRAARVDSSVDPTTAQIPRR